ncbi:MAG: murein biosynthesis integral membrane protein MurJ [Patescibacteria group bacterium]|nr:murein biosynthesis integral membrane protein MurJ [Patescibacteria group bacterium]MDD4610771.1 murein biosynthesis integral membrane protein MurJ [Patescibacteria group bacterium]
MIKKIFSGQINSITVAAALVAFSSLASRLLGVFRDRILAGQFGAGDTLDVYYAAFRVPDLIFNLLILGALSAGFIPILTGLIKSPLDKAKGFIFGEENKEAWIFSSNLLNILVVSLFILCGFGIVFAPGFVRLMTPGFSLEKQELTVALTRIMFLSPIFLGISSVFGGILQSFKRFFVYSLSPIMYNIGIIIGALYFVPIWGIYGLAIGVVFGAFLHMIVQLPSVYGLGYKYKFIFDWRNGNIKKIWNMMVPRTMSLAISQINLVVITIIASTLASGSLSVFNFANNLQVFPVGIFGISFAVAAFPTLASTAFNRTELVKNFSLTTRQILFFVIPSMVLLLTLRAQIIRVVLGAGNFDWEDTILTIQTLGYFSISLFAQSLVPLLIRMFYARHNSKTPFFIGLATAAANVLLAFYFARHMGVAGLALAFSFANILNFVLLWLALHFELETMDEIKILVSSIKFSASAVGCGLAVQGTKYFIAPLVNMTKLWGILAQGAIAGLFGIIVYIAMCSMFKSEELMGFWEAIKRRLPWKKIEAGDQGEARGI